GHARRAGGALRRGVQGKLVANDADAGRALRKVYATADGGDAAVGIKGIAVPLTSSDGDHYVAHVLPLTSGARRRAGATYSASAAVVLPKPPRDTPSPPDGPA